MKTTTKAIAVCAICLGLFVATPWYAGAQTNLASKERDANIVSEPKQMLRTGIDLCEIGVSGNSMQLSDTIGLTPILKSMEELRAKIAAAPKEVSLERITTRQDLIDATQKATLLIQKANLEIDFTLAEIMAEQMVYTEVLDTYYDDRDRALAKTNALSFVSNGALWAVCEGLAIPTYKHSRYAISSGITGILAGLIPSAASMYALKQVQGRKKTSEVEPNMLAKLFDYPTTYEIEYPNTVWAFLNQVPFADKTKKTRREQLIDQWVQDANIHTFNDRRSKRQTDIITASVAHKKGLTIETLKVRKVMLQKLTGELMKIKRMLLELDMAVLGEKHYTAYDESRPKQIGVTNGGVPK